ncbi:helicase, RecD/TraA family [Natranaerobius thermophilus JW/NM-WN-LF]|uniref:ATP-dependent RecD2 DNA helicase n=2 Tax=Natranaerobius TaxID=375928 RepID=B2A8J3_NATTJ|nr:helicase, RecD/TraA family [Natranaerobius thermophilus JW/NM-WN-LF]
MEMAQIEGIIKRVTYHNPENMFTVAKLVTQETRNEITIVGNMPHLTPGERLDLSGEYVDHKKFGKQFQVDSYEIKLPVTVDGLIKFLSSGMIKGIGPKTAESLVEHFGKEVLQVIENTPEKLQEVPGIGKEKAAQISRGFQEHKQIKDIMVFLQEFGVSPAFALKIYRRFGDNTIQKVSENPYSLAREVFGIGFKTADKIAREMGVSVDSEERAKAAVVYLLEEKSQDGNTFLKREELIEALKELEVENVNLNSVLEELVEEKEIVVENIPEAGELIYPAPFFFAEQGIASRLKRLKDGVDRELFPRIQKIAEKYLEEQANLVLSPEQHQVIKQVPETGLMVVTGGPGTGKTTVIKCLMDIFQKAGQKVMLAAPTGRAAKRMSEATGDEAKTIHRLLEFTYDKEEGMKFQRNQDRPLKGDLLIVDEASMIDTILMNNLLKAISPGTRLVLVGDTDQLPSVGAGNVLQDIIESGRIPLVRLKRVFRQARESMVVVNAHRINEGKFPILNAKGKDFYFLPREEPEDVVKTIISLCAKRLPNYNGYHPVNDIQVLSPMRRTVTGVENLNQSLQKVLNPPQKNKAEINFGGACYRTGDKVMQVKNDYEKNVFNGDTGIVTKVDAEENVVNVRYGHGEEIAYEGRELDALVHAYCISVHKSQGSEYPVVVLPVTTQHYIMLQRNLLYTAVTRAKSLVVLVGTKKSIGIAISNKKTDERNTFLQHRIAVYEV